MKTKNLQFLFLGMILFVVSYSAFAAYQKQKQGPVFLDTPVFQRYQERWGVWVNLKAEKKTVLEKAAEFGIHAGEVYELNQITDAEFNKRPRSLFFPYSQEYMIGLQEQGQFRETIDSPLDQFIWPVLPNHKTRISSRIGRRWNTLHTGIDIAIPKRSVVLASADGIVEESGRSGDYGLTVKIYHHEMNHFHTVYGHNDEVLVQKGDRVKKGQIIAFSGNTGKSTGPHVHFEVRYQNVYLNPENFLSPYEEGVSTNLVGLAD